MKALLALTTALLLAPALSAAQAPTPAASTLNPVASSAQQIYARQAKNLVAAADEMPADKYTYRPTPEQMTFAKIVSHVAQSNGALCGLLSGTPAPTAVKVNETASKQDLIAALNASFEFCGNAMDHLQDSQLGDSVTFRGNSLPRARALLELTGDLQDHYSQMAGYLRLNGLLPPSAGPRK